MNTLFATVTPPRPLAPLSAVASRVFVRDLVLDALIGVYEHERKTPQRIRLNLELDLARCDPATREPASSAPAREPTGEDGVGVIRAVLAQGHITLIETLAERIAELCLDDVRVRAVKVRVEKLDVFPDAASVGIEIERDRTSLRPTG